ncbi:ATP-binding protein [Spirillospora sp. NBC_01491]|uniref:ATP-binding protein n=1 Tax=Spirillospora sp. NBC_01491 TaxID=2976007 RepID=UPI002E319065|nr:AAA family ATPase [Spirillospora sp. NBC_01491]
MTTGERVLSPVLVGRDEHLARLVMAVTRPPAVVVVEGEAGIGKSRLVAELETRPEVSGRRLLSGACRSIREPFPLGPVVEALRDTREHLAPDTLSPVAGALRGLLPELADVLPDPPEPLDDRTAEKYRVFRGLSEVLSALTPAILVIEDLHWADEQTTDFLSYLLPGPPDGLSVVLTFREEEATPTLRTAILRPSPSVTYARLVLEPLDARQTGRLAAAILAAGELTEEFAAHLCERASGLPLAIQELLALLKARGHLVRRRGGWERRTLEELDVPVGVRDPVLERFARLSDTARAVAEAAAVLQVPVPIPVLGATCLRGPGDALDEILESGMLQARDGRIAFRHVLASQAVYESIPLSRAQKLHAAAATALRTLRPIPLGQVAHHLRRADRVDEWVEAAERAAGQATELGDDAEAVRLLEEVLRTAPLEPERRAELAVRLGWAVHRVLRVPDVSHLIEGALDGDLPRMLRGELRFLLALHYHVVRADPASRHQALVAAVEDLDGRPDLAAWTMVALGIPTLTDVAPGEQLAWVDRALALIPKIGNPDLRLFVTGKAAMLLVIYGDPRWAVLMERLLAETGSSPGSYQEADSFYSIGLGGCLGGHYGTARSMLAAARDWARDRSDEMLYRCRAILALISFCTGSWSELDEEIAVLLDRLSARPTERITVEAVAAGLAVTRGEPGASDRVRDVMVRAAASGEMDLLPLPVSALLRCEGTRGDVAAVVEETAAHVASWEAMGLWALGARAVPAFVEALLGAGRAREATELLSRYEAAMRDQDAPLATSALRHARGHLAAAAGQPREAAAHLVAAAESYDRLPAPYEAAQAREQAAACLLDAGNADGGTVLRAAIATYEGLGVRRDLDRATRLARRGGVALPARHRGGHQGYGAQLSPRERQVADLAASGLMNKEIAQELFVSVKTVEGHLRLVLRKLGLRSRTELARYQRSPDLQGSPDTANKGFPG